MRVLLSAVAALILCIPVTDAKDDLDAYPKPQAGQQCWTVKLPKIDREKLCKVEIIVGANLLLDPKNLYFLGDILSAKDLRG